MPFRVWQWLFYIWLALGLVGAVPHASHVVQPLSKLSPLDLGFLPISRPSEGVTAPRYERFCWSTPRSALPTNAWWVPAVLQRSPTGLNYITQLPYVFHLLPSQITVMYPHVQATEHEVSHIYPNNTWTFASVSPLATGFCVSRADEFTATFLWKAGATKVMQTTLVRGSPYVTVAYTNAIPVMSIEQHVDAYWLDGKSHKYGVFNGESQ